MILIKNLRNSLFRRSSGASTCFNFKSALTCYRALLEVLSLQNFLMCYFTGLTVEFTETIACLATFAQKPEKELFSSS